MFEAEVVRVEPFGIFVRVNCDKDGVALNLEGLVHISEVSWEKVSELSQMFKAKDKIKIKTVDILLKIIYI